MKVFAIICEYNPFHLGHLHLIEEARRHGADYIIAIMSGNFVQRGAPAFMDKYTRTEIALNMGVDMVLELPLPYACGSSEIFSQAAVSIAHKTGIVTDIIFGAEYNHIEVLKAISQILLDEPPAFKTILKDMLSSGKSYAYSKYNGLLEYIYESSQNPLKNVCSREEMSDILFSPNNNLAIEYLKSLKRLNSNINPIAIKRINSDYHSTAQDTCSYSASALRHNICLNGPLTLEHPFLSDIYEKKYNTSYPINSKDFSLLVGQALLQNNSFDKFYGINTSFSNKLIKLRQGYKDFDSFAMSLKSKEITYTSICRNLLHILLDISKEAMDSFIANDFCDYVSVLGFRRNASGLLGMLQKNLLTIINPQSDTDKLSDTFKSLYKLNAYGDSLYRMVQMNKFGTDLPADLSRRLITV